MTRLVPLVRWGQGNRSSLAGVAVPMKAARFTRYGPASQVVVVDELSRPEPGAHDVLVRNHASSINFGNMAHIRGNRSSFGS